MPGSQVLALVLCLIAFLISGEVSSDRRGHRPAFTCRYSRWRYEVESGLRAHRAWLQASKVRFVETSPEIRTAIRHSTSAKTWDPGKLQAHLDHALKSFDHRQPVYGSYIFESKVRQVS